MKQITEHKILWSNRDEKCGRHAFLCQRRPRQISGDLAFQSVFSGCRGGGTNYRGLKTKKYLFSFVYQPELWCKQTHYLCRKQSSSLGLEALSSPQDPSVAVGSLASWSPQEYRAQNGRWHTTCCSLSIAAFWTVKLGTTGINTHKFEGKKKKRTTLDGAWNSIQKSIFITMYI